MHASCLRSTWKTAVARTNDRPRLALPSILNMNLSDLERDELIEDLAWRMIDVMAWESVQSMAALWIEEHLHTKGDDAILDLVSAMEDEPV